MSDFKQTDIYIEDGELQEELAMIEDLDRQRQQANSNFSEHQSSCDSKSLTNNPMKFMMNYKDAENKNALPDLNSSEL